MTQELIPDVSLIDNSEERLPVVLALDCSGSMEGPKLEALQSALKDLDRDLKSDPKVAKTARFLVIKFGGDDHVELGPWQDIMDFIPPMLVANGRTPTGAAMLRALAEIKAQKQEMRSAGVLYKRPLVFLISDGAATDDWEEASKLCLAAMGANEVTIFPIGVGDDANIEQLSKFSAKGAMKLDGLKFKELFIWVSASIRVGSKAIKGQNTQIPPNDSWSSMFV